MPSIKGIIRSKITRSNPPPDSCASAAEPSPASSQIYPEYCRCSWISSRMRGSSSTIRIFAIKQDSSYHTSIYNSILKQELEKAVNFK
jgi:hypothetical protein